MKPLILRARLRLSLLSGAGDLQRAAGECASALTLDGDNLTDLPALVDTALLLCQASPGRVDPALLEAA